MTELLEAINIIREKSENGKLIIFVGSGVSRNVKGLPSWNGLVESMAKAVGYSKCDTCRKKENKCEKTCKLKTSYSTDEYLKIPQYLYNQDRRKYKRILSQNIKDIKVDAPLSSAIFDLNPVHIITTNYDTLLESSSNELCSQYKVVIEDKDLLISDANKYIIKMHGDINHKDSIVLKNLIESINYATIRYQSSFWATLTNSIVLISYLDLTKEESDVLEKHIETLLSNDKFIQYFFSVNFPDYHECLYHLAGLCQKVISKNHFEIFERIISAEYFYDYMINVNQNNVRALINSLLINPDDAELQNHLFNVCLAQKNTSDKIKLIWLVQSKIIDNANKQQISDFLDQHFAKISNRYLIDFILSDLIDFAEEKIYDFLNEVIKLDKEKHENSVQTIPDPLESKLEVLYILIIFDKINDINVLDDMYNKPIYLEFLLSPDDFDYSQVDFSDYIWQNFTKKEIFLEKFIKAKEQIKPKIMERLKIDAATDFEKKMLYGYFMAKSELLN